jgi:hypothetical protein
MRRVNHFLIIKIQQKTFSLVLAFKIFDLRSLKRRQLISSTYILDPYQISFNLPFIRNVKIINPQMSSILLKCFRYAVIAELLLFTST